MAMRKLGRFQDAIRDFSRAINLRRADANLFYNRGIIYMEELKQPVNAVKDFKRVLEIAPE
jgi:tetratricopeptide (TPR) repeat protein